MSTEARIQSEILCELGTMPGVMLWRNSVGVAVPLSGDAPQRFGVVGSADLLGSVTLRCGVAVPLAIEVKTPKGRVSSVQERWLACMGAAGWIVMVARSKQDALAQLAEGIAQAEQRVARGGAW